MTKQELNNLIIENINTNNAGLITGLVLQQVLLYLADYSSNKTELMELFLSKLEDDTAQGLITFLKGIEVGDFTTGALGSGAAIKMVDGTSYAEVDNLTVRQKATFRELIIEALKHIGGQLVLTPARMKCVRVVDGGTYYKCYFDTGDGEVSNEFVAGDQARCQVFTGSGTKFYWRLVTSVGDDWINLSKTDAVSGSDIPEAGDDIVQLGNRNDTTRQSAIILSTVGIDAPSWKQYSGINSFSLEGKETTVFSKLGNRIEGKTVFKSDGENLEEALDDVEERVLGIRIGGGNLLRNTGFLGDFNSLNLNPSALLTGNTAIDTNPLIHWVHSNVNIIDAPSKSGKGVHLGSLQQNTPVLEVGETYIVSFKAKGANLNIGLVNTVEVALTGEYQLFEYKMIPTETKSYVFSMTGDADVYEIQLEKATIRSDYNYSIEDDLKTISQIQAINTITAAIKEADTSILGGLILTSMLQLGKYKDGVMEKVTSGINGIYNNDDDPAVWAGGSLDDAIRTVQRLIDNPNNEPTEAEWAEMANIVLTHGGDGFFRGFIYALGGLFRGKIESNFNGNKIVIDPEDRSLKMFNSNGWLSLSMTFSQSEVGSHNDAKINVYTYKENGEVLQNTQISPGGVSVLSQNEIDGEWITDMTSIYLGGLQVLGYQSDGVDFTKNYEFSIHRNTITPGLDMEISTVGLPTTGEGLPDGMWYEENGYLRIKK